MAIGNIADVLRLKTVSPLQNVCAVRRVKTAMYCPRVGDCSKQNSAYSSGNALFFCLEVRLDGKTRATKAV